MFCKDKGCCDNPWHMLVFLLIVAALVYGLWNHDWYWIIGAIIVKVILILLHPKKKGRR